MLFGFELSFMPSEYKGMFSLCFTGKKTFGPWGLRTIAMVLNSIGTII